VGGGDLLGQFVALAQLQQLVGGGAQLAEDRLPLGLGVRQYLGAQGGEHGGELRAADADLLHLGQQLLGLGLLGDPHVRQVVAAVDVSAHRRVDDLLLCHLVADQGVGQFAECLVAFRRGGLLDTLEAALGLFVVRQQQRHQLGGGVTGPVHVSSE